MKWKNKNEEETKRLETKCHIRRGIIISPPLIFLHVEMEGKKKKHYAVGAVNGNA